MSEPRKKSEKKETRQLELERDPAAGAAADPGADADAVERAAGGEAEDGVAPMMMFFAGLWIGVGLGFILGALWVVGIVRPR